MTRFALLVNPSGGSADDDAAAAVLAAFGDQGLDVTTYEIDGDPAVPARRAADDGCDVLVHEVYSAERFRERPPEWQRYHADAHTSTAELGALATRARPKLLVLYHQLFWSASDDDLVREVRSGYAGAVVSARDLGVYP